MNKNYDLNKGALNPEQLKEACAKIKHVALDMDGTIYLGSTLFPFTVPFLNQLKEAGIGYTFLTNNPTRNRMEYFKKLKDMGVPVKPENIYTSSLATIDYLKVFRPEVKTLFLLGTPGMMQEFTEAGYELLPDDPHEVPDALIVAFDTTLEYKRLCHAAWLAQNGVFYIATNPDRVCPTDKPTVLVDCGSICACIEYATGVKPSIVIGKPNPDMLTCIAATHGLKPEEIAMCGDRIYTDVATAQNAGGLGVLVLSGETTLEVALVADRLPDIIVPSIAEFGEMLK